MFFKNSLSASWPVRELSSPRLDWPRVGLLASCPVSYIGLYNMNTKNTILNTSVWRLDPYYYYTHFSASMTCPFPVLWGKFPPTDNTPREKETLPPLVKVNPWAMSDGLLWPRYEKKTVNTTQKHRKAYSIRLNCSSNFPAAQNRVSGLLTNFGAHCQRARILLPTCCEHAKSL